MLGWFQAIMPKEDKFFDLFEQHAGLFHFRGGRLNRIFSARHAWHIPQVREGNGIEFGTRCGEAEIPSRVG